MNTTQIRKGDRIEVIKTGETGTVAAEVTFRTNAGRSRKQVSVKWDNVTARQLELVGDTWTILVSNIKKI